MKESEYFPAANFDGSCDLPAGDSYFQSLNPSFDEVNQRCSLEALPIIIDEASFPVEEKCAFRNSHGQDVFDFSILSEESKTTSQFTSQLAFLSFVELPLPPKKQMCSDAQFSCHNFIDLQMESEDSYSPCVVDIDIEMETIAKPKSGGITVGSIENEDPLTVSSVDGLQWGGAETGKPENLWEIHATFYKSRIIIAEVNF
ncbi:hypothetical protein POTOM_028526 [Populus tomentosa]|uniref:Uncharacterized protein n=1 Tax=Populus tomentosa TaxID=118781 RepID=A0A8X7ZGQ9_POPTO|nr:hypothetical protein POTOM_028526 [Populus tomentosa]